MFDLLRRHARLCQILSLLFVVGISTGSDASCRLKLMVSSLIERVDEFIAQKRTSVDQKEREKFREAAAIITKMDIEIRDQRKLVGIWEAEVLLRKRFAALSMQLMILQDQTDLAIKYFSPEIVGFARGAVDYKASQAAMATIREEIQFETNRVKLRTLNADLEKEIEAGENAKAVMQTLGPTVASLLYVLRLMEKRGVLVDVSTLFYGNAKLRDIDGNDIDEDQIRPPSEPGGALESAALSSDQRVMRTAMNDAVAEQGTPAPATPESDTKNGGLTPEHLDVQQKELIRERAAYIIKALNEYFKAEETKGLVHNIAARTAVALKPMSLKELDDLYESIKGDWQTMAQRIQRRQAILLDLRHQRRKLRATGPLIGNTLRGYVAKSDSKFAASLEPLVRLTELDENATQLYLHGSEILKVLSKREAADRVDLLYNYEGNSNKGRKGEMLIAFIRFCLTNHKFRQIWQETKNALEKSEINVDKQALARWNKYEEIASENLALSNMDQTTDRHGLRLLAFKGLAVTGVAYVGVSYGPTWIANAWKMSGLPDLSEFVSAESFQGLWHLIQSMAHLGGG